MVGECGAGAGVGIWPLGIRGSNEGSILILTQVVWEEWQF